jgi:hypothetical protein
MSVQSTVEAATRNARTSRSLAEDSGATTGERTDLAKIRVDMNVTEDTKTLIDVAVDEEKQDDKRNDRPPRSKSAILEAILRQALRYRQKQREQDVGAR